MRVQGGVRSVRRWWSLSGSGGSSVCNGLYVLIQRVAALSSPGVSVSVFLLSSSSVPPQFLLSSSSDPPQSLLSHAAAQTCLTSLKRYSRPRRFPRQGLLPEHS